jgi:hypothetical protein
MTGTLRPNRTVRPTSKQPPSSDNPVHDRRARSPGQVYFLHHGHMGAQRVVVVVTSGVVAVLAVVLVALRWDSANKVAVVVSALAAVAAVGVGIWAALPRGGTRTALWVSRTGNAKAGVTGSANSGVESPAAALPHDVNVTRTGGSEGGNANTGVRLS